MKNKELIEKLLKLDMEAEVCTRSDNPELQQALVSIEQAQLTQGMKSIETFRGLMFGSRYEKEVYQCVPGGGANIIVLLT